MPQKCCISGCRNSRWKRRKPNKEITYQTFPNEGKEITFHYFPKDEEVNRRWKYHINLCTKQENVGKNPVICSAHFNESDVIKRKTNVILRNLAVPCVFPNMNYTDYEVLYYPDDKENVEPNAKKIKLDVESLKLNASTPFWSWEEVVALPKTYIRRTYPHIPYHTYYSHLKLHKLITFHEFDFERKEILKKVRKKGVLKIHEANQIILHGNETVNFKSDAAHISPVFYNIIMNNSKTPNVNHAEPTSYRTTSATDVLIKDDTGGVTNNNNNRNIEPRCNLRKRK